MVAANRMSIRSSRKSPLVFAGLTFAVALGMAARPVSAHAEGAAQPNEIVAGEIVVGFRTEAGGAQTRASLRAVGQDISVHTATHLHRIKLAPGVTIEAAIAALRSRGDVLFAEPNHIIHAAAAPNDASYSSQWAPQKVQADLAWGIWNPQAQVILAIVDTGVDNTHPDLTGKMLRDNSGAVVGYDAINQVTGNGSDLYGHGTHCAGIAAAQIDNGVGIAGIAGWNGVAGASDTSYIKIMPVRVLDATGSGSDTSVAGGITWAADHGAKVISLSLGGGGGSSAMLTATNYAWSKGCLVVAAAGNSSTNAMFYPAGNPNVVSVAATDSTDTMASFSNYGTWVTVAAPGASIYSTLPTYTAGAGWPLNYGTLSGTSMATPHVAGEAALIFAQNPSLTNQQVSSLITTNVDTYNAAGHSIAAGAGRINVYRALLAAGGTPQVGSLSGVTVAPVSVISAATATGTVSLSAAVNTSTVIALSSNSAAASVPATVTVAAGQSTATFTVTGGTVSANTTATITANYNAVSKTANLTVTPAPTGTSASATFVKLDTKTQGNWKGVYGASGYSIANDSSSTPAFAQMNITGASTWSWAGSTSDVRGLTKGASTTDRIEACWYSVTSFTMDINITDGQTHQVALYGLDWEPYGRGQRIDVVDATTGAVLNSQTQTGFGNGQYLVWNISGHVQFKVVCTASVDSVIGGVFFK